MKPTDQLWHSYEIQLEGEMGWYADGMLTLRPGESAEAERKRIEADEHRPCRLVGQHTPGGRI